MYCGWGAKTPIFLFHCHHHHHHLHVADEPTAEKRNIGSLARQGLLRSDYNNLLNPRAQQLINDKRHLGALARTGWFTAYRSARGGRVSRSERGRSRTVGF